MSLITPELLLKMRPELPPEKAEVVATKLEAALRKFGIITDEGPVSRNRVAHVLSQLATESGFLPIEENLNYSAKRLREVWPNRFTQALAEECAGNPEMIANVAYGDRMGNTQPGEGWKYRGRSAIQLTGKANYEAYGKAIGYDLVNHPELLLEVGISSLVAAAYLRDHRWKGLSFVQLCDNTATGWDEQVRNVTSFVNGGQNGIEDRRASYKQACLLLGVELRVILPLPSPLTPENIPPLPLPRRPQFYYPVPMGDGDDDFHNEVGQYKDLAYFEELGMHHPGADLNQHRKKPGQGVDRELGHRYGVIFDGVVVYTGAHRVWGNVTEVEHVHPRLGYTFWTQYAHSDVVMVKVGQEVYGGRAIGTIGKGGGQKLPAHLHLEGRRYGPVQLPPDFWASTKYPAGPKDPQGKQALACIDRNYFDIMAFLKEEGAINPTF